MLVLSRKIGESVVIGDSIVVTINRIAGNRVTLGIAAPDDVRVLRSELMPTDTSTDPQRPDGMDSHDVPPSRLRLVAR